LERVQRHALRLICTVFRTSPINALEIEASIPLVRLALDRDNHRAGIRLNKLSAENPVIQRLPDAWRHGRAPSLHRVRRVGAGVAIYREDDEIFAHVSGLGSRAEVYDSELAAMLFGACKAIALAETSRETNNVIKHIHFFADNTAAITTIFTQNP
ncbi:hypothetical protein B0H17DRAFT_836392, partial [Mycena rosella]